MDGDHRKTCKLKCCQQTSAQNYQVMLMQLVGQKFFTDISKIVVVFVHSACSKDIKISFFEKAQGRRLTSVLNFLPSRGFSLTKSYPSKTHPTATPSNSDEFLWIETRCSN